MDDVRDATVVDPSRDGREVFGGLGAPTVAELVGVWSGRMTGPVLVRWLSLAIAAPTPMRGWCGKRIGPTGEVANLVRRGARVRDSKLADASPGTSLLDGRSAVVVDYTRSGRPPVSRLRGELRWLAPDREILGMLMMPIGRFVVGPFPFRMERADPGQPRGQ